MVAGLQGDIDGGAGQFFGKPLFRIINGINLGMGLPRLLMVAFPDNLPLLTTTAPTQGLGEVNPLPLAARARAFSMKAGSVIDFICCAVQLGGLALPGQQSLEFFKEIRYILELPVHACKPHISHIINFFQGEDNLFAYRFGGDFPFVALPKIFFNGIHHIFDLVYTDGPLFTSLLHTPKNLFPVELLRRLSFFTIITGTCSTRS